LGAPLDQAGAPALTWKATWATAGARTRCEHRRDARVQPHRPSRAKDLNAQSARPNMLIGRDDEVFEW